MSGSAFPGEHLPKSCKGCLGGHGVAENHLVEDEAVERGVDEERNFESLIGSSGTLMWTLIASVPVAAAVGLVIGRPVAHTEHVAEAIDTTIVPVD
ncbi:hypothetical protein ACWDTI_11495 [Gordonia sp. NPDC003424]